jgi:hypothetical protein
LAEVWGSNLHGFDFTFAGELFCAADLFVGHLLDFFSGALLFVFGDLLLPGACFYQWPRERGLESLRTCIRTVPGWAIVCENPSLRG